MFSRLIKLTFFGCFLIAACVPAEAGIFDRILKRKGGRAVGCCAPQPVCAQAQCAPAPCAPLGCTPAPCTGSSCLDGYRDNLAFCKVIFENDPEGCRECQKEAVKAYCECTSATNSLRRYAPACAAHPEEKSIDTCNAFKDACERLQQAGGPNNCSLCWFECLRLIPSSNPTPTPIP